jgi:hypothetical protein
MSVFNLSLNVLAAHQDETAATLRGNAVVGKEERILGKGGNGGGGGGNGGGGQNKNNESITPSPTTPSPTKSPSTITPPSCAQKDQSCKFEVCCNPSELECTGKGNDKKCTEIPNPPPTNDCYNRDAGMTFGCLYADRIDCTLTVEPPVSQILGYPSNIKVTDCGDDWKTIGCCPDGTEGYYKIDFCSGFGFGACCAAGQADTNAGCVTLTNN